MFSKLCWVRMVLYVGRAKRRRKRRRETERPSVSSSETLSLSISLSLSSEPMKFGHSRPLASSISCVVKFLSKRGGGREQHVSSFDKRSSLPAFTFGSAKEVERL
jgi:hypothetical protein